MAKTIDVSGWPTRAFQYLVASSFVFGALFIAAFLLWKALTALDVAIPYADSLVWPAVFAVLWAVLTFWWVRHLRRADGEWWGPVPRDQYLGRFAGYGGLARHSWERSIEQLPDDDQD